MFSHNVVVYLVRECVSRERGECGEDMESRERIRQLVSGEDMESRGRKRREWGEQRTEKEGVGRAENGEGGSGEDMKMESRENERTIREHVEQHSSRSKVIALARNHCACVKLAQRAKNSLHGDGARYLSHQKMIGGVFYSFFLLSAAAHGRLQLG